MASKRKTEPAAQSQVPVAAASAAVATVPQEFLDHADKGNEHVTAEDVSTPFLAIIQSGSPQRKKANDKYIDGAEEGDIFMTVGGQLFKDVLAVPCAFQSRWVEWTPRDKGGGFVRAYDIGERPPGVRKGDIRVKLSNGNDAVKHHYHYVVIMDEEGVDAPMCVIAAMKSTDLKPSSDWNSRILANKMPGSGRTYPRYAQKWRMGTIAKSNDQGDWHGWFMNPEGVLNLDNPYERAVWNTAVEFHNLIASGDLQVKYDAQPDSTGGGNDDEDPLPPAADAHEPF